MTRSLFDRRAECKETWADLNRRMKGLPSAAYHHAMLYEPYSEFPGVDIDTVHRKVSGDD